MTFNKVYRMFRTTEVIVDQFIFEIQSNLLFSLRLAHKDDPSMKTEQIISSAVRNITRIIVVYAKAGKLLKKQSKRRDFESLTEFVEQEIFPGTNRPEEKCRKECMSIFTQLVPYLPGIKSPQAWIQKKLQIESIKWLLDSYESSQNDILQIFNNTNPGDSMESIQYSSLLAYYVKLNSLLDSYIWMFKEDFIEPSILAAGKQKSILFSKVFEFIKYFSLANCESISSTSTTGDDKNSLCFFNELSPQELDIYNRHKTEVILACFRLFSLLLDKFPEFHFPENIYEDGTFYELLFYSILTPSWIGFSSSQYLAIDGALHTVCNHFCYLLESKLPSPKKTILYETLKVFIKDPKMNLLTLAKNSKKDNQSSTSSSMDVQASIALVDGYKILLQTKLLHPSKFGKYTNSLGKHLFSDLFNNCYSYGPNQLYVGKKIFSLCADLNLDYHLILKCLLDDEIIMDNDNSTIIVPTTITNKKDAPTSTNDDDDDDDVDMDSTSTVNDQHCSSTPISRTDTLGSIFYHQFIDQICLFLIQNISSVIEEIFKQCAKNNSLFWTILFGMIDLNIKQIRPSVPFLESICKHIHILSDHFKHHATDDKSTSNTVSHHQKENILDLCKKLFLLNEEYVMNQNNDGYLFIFKTFQFFTSKELPLSQKMKALFLISPLLKYSDDKMDNHHDDIKLIIDELLIYNFPSKFQDIPKGSTLYSDIQECLEQLMDSLIKSQHVLLGRCLLPLLRYGEDEPEHSFSILLDSFWKKFISHLSDHANLEFFNFTIHEYYDCSHKNQIRCAIIKKLCVPLLRHLSIPSCIQAVSPHISQFMKVVCGEIFTPVHDPDKNYTNLIERTCIFKLIQAIFDVLPSKSIKESLNHIYCPTQSSKKNELTTDIMRSAHTAKSKKLSSNDINVPDSIIREYQCTAFNALASVVMCTQTNPTFFNVFFFKENPAKNEFIWENIIDTSISYHFEVETHFPTLKNISKQVRMKISNNNNQGDDDDAITNTQGDIIPRSKYVSSQYLMDSSLSQDITYLSSLYNSQHSSSMNVQENTKYEQLHYGKKQEKDNQQISDENDENAAASNHPHQDELELDPINENPCMQSLLRLIDHIQSQFAHTFKDNQMPEWMKFIHSIFISSTSHPNILLFLGKLIINRPYIFEPYANEWIEPLISLALSSSISKSFNYYFRDLCITLLLKWPTVMPNGAAQQRLTSLMFNQMIANVIYPSRFIIHCNIDIIKLFVERWKGNFIPSKKLILDMIAYDEKRSASRSYRITGLQILGVLVANDLPFYDSVHDKSISEAQLSSFVSKNLYHSYKEVYCTSAEVCGLIFKKEGITSDFAKLIQTTLNSIYATSDSARFLYILQAIGKHAPNYLDYFFTKIFSILPKLVGSFRVIG